MTIQARLETLKTTSRRTSPRRKLSLSASLPSSGMPVVIHDISTTGVLLQTAAKLEPFDDFEIDLPEIGATSAFVVWNSGEYFGCEFANPVSRAAVSAALLRSPIVQPDTAVAVEEDSEVDDPADGRFALGTRLRAILGISIALWAVLLWLVGVL
ncbi:PilZ domain-containing protein [Sphingomonas daechungensis]|uniref:PilZ domain-containing protein n=1 Tax=Sphingomonas daechungensis TaxID=1176646 RepID=UPI00378451D2